MRRPSRRSKAIQAEKGPRCVQGGPKVRIRFPPAAQRTIVRCPEDIERLASSIRRDWNLGLDPIPSMTGLLEDKGVKVIAVDIPKKLSGFTGDVRRPEGKLDVSVIVVSTQFSIERRRFTLAHELAHRVIGESDDLKLEKATDRFAAAFLIPAEHLREEAKGARDAVPPYRELVRLKHFYGVAAAAMLMRLKDIGILSDPTVSTLSRPMQGYGALRNLNRWIPKAIMGSWSNPLGLNAQCIGHWLTT
jgi:Zn-dependent peptidase ImmA (M78 family)